MLPDKVRGFATETHRGVLTTFRRNGAAQMSIISCGPFRDGVAFTVTEERSKLWNLRRDPPLLAAGVPGKLVGVRGVGGPCPGAVRRQHRPGAASAGLA